MTIDERLQFLLTSTESLHESCRELHATVQQQADMIKAQAEMIERHEHRWELVRRVMRAALEAGLSDNGDQQEA
jgi:nitroimidazol reductase NimA-like FMN-containing flavoprotein (pyridoxamine 5'-phosphate oxidase superfamily)